MIIRGLVHIDASGLVEENGSRGANNPPFAMRLQRMGHPIFNPIFVSILFRICFVFG
jgi:hypothetical protein